jgi:predicted signal transduction protein with EAL and GGDEF domain
MELGIGDLNFFWLYLVKDENVILGEKEKLRDLSNRKSFSYATKHEEIAEAQERIRLANELVHHDPTKEGGDVLTDASFTRLLKGIMKCLIQFHTSMWELISFHFFFAKM